MVRSAAAGVVDVTVAAGPAGADDRRRHACRSSWSACCSTDCDRSRCCATPAVAAGALAVGAVADARGRARSGRADARRSTRSRWTDALLDRLRAGGGAGARHVAFGVDDRDGACFSAMRRDAAARFTFLLAIPAMLAAAAKEALELAGMSLGRDVPARVRRRHRWCRRSSATSPSSTSCVSSRGTGSTSSPGTVSRWPPLTVVWLWRALIQWLRRSFHHRILRHGPARHQRRRVRLDLPAGRRVRRAALRGLARARPAWRAHPGARDPHDRAGGAAGRRVRDQRHRQAACCSAPRATCCACRCSGRSMRR